MAETGLPGSVHEHSARDAGARASNLNLNERKQAGWRST
jgi:hypothetical protein